MNAKMTSDDLHCYVSDSESFEPRSLGGLNQVNVAVKDLFSLEGRTSSFGHPRWRDTHEPATQDSYVVDTLLSEGARIDGFAKMDQLAYSLIGNVGEGEAPVNTHDRSMFCGGSSSGSASAVAAGLVELGVGTDTAGSIRVPAAACGLFGLRPTHGVVSTEGAIPWARSLDAIGLLSKDIELLQRAFLALADGHSGDSAQIETVLIPVDIVAGLGDDQRKGFESIADALREVASVAVEEVELGRFVSHEVGDAFARLQSREIWDAHAEWVSSNIDYLAPDVQTRLRRCEALSGDPDAVKEADLAWRAEFVSDVLEAMSGAAVLFPVLPAVGPRRSWSDEELLAYRLGCFRLTAPSSLAGIPQLVAPSGTVDGPVAASFLGPRGSEDQLFELWKLIS